MFSARNSGVFPLPKRLPSKLPRRPRDAESNVEVGDGYRTLRSFLFCRGILGPAFLARNGFYTLSQTRQFLLARNAHIPTTECHHIHAECTSRGWGLSGLASKASRRSRTSIPADSKLPPALSSPGEKTPIRPDCSRFRLA